MESEIFYQATLHHQFLFYVVTLGAFCMFGGFVLLFKGAVSGLSFAAEYRGFKAALASTSPGAFVIVVGAAIIITAVTDKFHVLLP
ncbi:hypothetical protein [Microbulbifer rhizosphaerae]|uniref:Uncharacterized protein n=1 Tax=Microbulbifer rhizosphaerae TaxID=1562603 RepID=A0A7W4WHJ5_9GAMM|nr:hypothetical protein [Microbulbifer rhizosphaerae]MBB3063726.1 hypothetical protein [Microbulbifer rhizosphaerae]